LFNCRAKWCVRYVVVVALLILLRTALGAMRMTIGTPFLFLYLSIALILCSSHPKP
ncbi:hypothetical protein BAE44_0025598, partial [Dichanthelium oligosanthes]